jgi:hypothetical protein
MKLGMPNIIYLYKPSSSDVETAIRQLKSYKSPGIDQIPA